MRTNNNFVEKFIATQKKRQKQQKRKTQKKAKGKRKAEEWRKKLNKSVRATKGSAFENRINHFYESALLPPSPCHRLRVTAVVARTVSLPPCQLPLSIVRYKLPLIDCEQ